VRTSAKKKRFILDLRYVNEHLKPPKFKLDDLKVALQYVEKGGYMICFDINSGYFHLDVNVSFFSFLGFSWFFKGKKRFFVFTVLPFGLSLGPFLFTKLLRPLISHWRQKGIKCLIYIDDGFVTAADLASTKQLSKTCKRDLEDLGFFLNEKCVWDPVQELKFLGFQINLNDFSVSAPKEKIDGTVQAISKTLSGVKVSARQVSAVAGKIISMSIVLGNVTRLMTRFLYAFISCSATWDRPRR
jgi:hypothetical protein